MRSNAVADLAIEALRVRLLDTGRRLGGPFRPMMASKRADARPLPIARALLLETEPLSKLAAASGLSCEPRSKTLNEAAAE
jgi:hypothetical protein